jgi:hypothetical protein
MKVDLRHDYGRGGIARTVIKELTGKFYTVEWNYDFKDPQAPFWEKELFFIRPSADG